MLTQLILVHFVLRTATKLCWGYWFPPRGLCTCPLHQLFCQLCSYLFSGPTLFPVDPWGGACSSMNSSSEQCKQHCVYSLLSKCSNICNTLLLLLVRNKEQSDKEHLCSRILQHRDTGNDMENPICSFPHTLIYQWWWLLPHHLGFSVLPIQCNDRLVICTLFYFIAFIWFYFYYFIMVLELVIVLHPARPCVFQSVSC